MAARRFPPPWTVEETAPCFIVRDANKQGLAFVYFEDEPGRRAAASLLTRDEAWRITAGIARLPDHERKPTQSPHVLDGWRAFLHVLVLGTYPQHYAFLWSTNQSLVMATIGVRIASLGLALAVLWPSPQASAFGIRLGPFLLFGGRAHHHLHHRHVVRRPTEALRRPTEALRRPTEALRRPTEAALRPTEALHSKATPTQSVAQNRPGGGPGLAVSLSVGSDELGVQRDLGLEHFGDRAILLSVLR
jgi:hypothetical protein